MIFYMSSKMVTNSSGAERCIQDIGEDRGRLDLTAGEVLFQHYVVTTFISSSAGCVCRFSSSRASFTSSTSTDGQTVGPLQPLLSPGRALPDTLISYTRTGRNRTLQQLCLFENGVFGHLGAPTSILVSPSTTRRCSWTAQGAFAAQDASRP